MIHLGIGIPCYGSKLDVGHAAMWLGMGAALATTQHLFKLTMMADYHINGIDLCRDTILWDAAQAGCDWVLMIDADTFHRAAPASGGHGAAVAIDAIGDVGVDLLQMILDADRFEEAERGPCTVGLIGAPVRGRGVGDAGVCVQDAQLQPLTLAALRGQITPVYRLGGACIAVNLRWLRQHWPVGPWFRMVHAPGDLREIEAGTGRPHHGRGEDYDFCEGIHQRGGRVLCDGRFVPEHVDRRRLVGEVP